MGWRIELDCKTEAERMAQEIFDALCANDCELVAEALDIAVKEIKGLLIYHRLNKEESAKTLEELKNLEGE